jgi:hypothetical protein
VHAAAAAAPVSGIDVRDTLWRYRDYTVSQVCVDEPLHDTEGQAVAHAVKCTALWPIHRAAAGAHDDQYVDRQPIRQWREPEHES